MSRITALLSAALLACIAPCLAADPAMDEARKVLNADLAVIRQTGQPATIEDLPKPTTLPAAQNALTDLRAAVKALDSESDAYQAYSQMQVYRPLGPSQVQILRQVASENQQSIELVSSARAKPLGWDIEMKPPLLDLKLPDLGQQRRLANVIFAGALASHAEGDDAAALARIDDMLYLARAADLQGITISHLVALAITSKATDAVDIIVPALQFGQDEAVPKQLTRLIGDLLDDTPSKEGLRKALCNERVFLADTVLAFANGAIPPADVRAALEDANTIAQNRAGPPALPDDDTLRRLALTDTHIMLEHLAKLIATVGADWPSTKAALPTPLPKAPEHPFATVVEPVYQRQFESHFKAVAARRLAAAALAARWFAHDHQDELPARLRDLVPTYLPAVPRDPFAPESELRYDRAQGILHSIGVDGANAKATDTALTCKLR